MPFVFLQVPLYWHEFLQKQLARLNIGLYIYCKSIPWDYFVCCNHLQRLLVFQNARINFTLGRKDALALMAYLEKHCL